MWTVWKRLTSGLNRVSVINAESQGSTKRCPRRDESNKGGRRSGNKEKKDGASSRSVDGEESGTAF